MDLILQLSQELNISAPQVEATVKLIDEGNTIPFIARYRKEVTGSLDDAQLRDLDDRLTYLRGLAKRKDEVRSSIEEQGKLTEELAAAIAAAKTLAEVEDLYRPYKQKRKTRASMAREKGLAPLAEAIRAQNTLAEPLSMAAAYIDAEKGVETAEAALAGALDIIAEDISDDAAIRRDMRLLINRLGRITATGDSEDATYAMYADFSEQVSKIASHRVLAINRGTKEGKLKSGLEVPEDAALELICRHVVTAKNACGRACAEAAADSWKRLLAPSLENETFSTLFEAASEQAIKVFGENLHHLLMQPPVKGHVVLGLDPAYRTGCKIAVVDDTGKVLDTTVIYPTPPQSRIPEAKATLKKLIAKHNVSVISIGNGTASRESEQFVAELIPELDRPVSYVIVSEAGASVYSASKLASEEFPEYDVSLRSAASIARRLQDPLAELVKIDPKAIGIGQYQHDMPKARLDSTLGGVVEQCVNSVGVDLNTASPSLLSHIAGINSGIAKNVVSYREENGGFRSRAELLKVPKLGKKAYEQCAGFLRLSGSSNPLDGTAVHPESYKAAKALLEKCGFKLTDIGSEKLADLPNRLEQQGLSALAEQLDIGVPTIRDIAAELVKPGRDPRDSMPPPLLRTDVMEMKDLKPDMILTGTVRNVIDFGAFVDIGVHEDGLVHISQLSDRFIKHPSQAVKVGDIVKVKVLEVDLRRKRISLTMKGLQ
ncbi:MAG: Tex family protein [Angelakisella sp.]